MQLSVLTPATVADQWPAIKAHLELANNPEQGGPGVAELELELAAGTATLVQVIDDGKIIVLASLSLDGDTLVIDRLVGNGIDTVRDEFMAFIDQFAALENATRIMISGRKGWARYLADYGYTEVWRVLVKHTEKSTCQAA